MYTREEISKQKQQFWTAFGQYMRPIPSADDTKVNWVNYKTGVPGIRFIMDAGGHRAIIGIELSHTDPALQAGYYSRFTQLRNVLHEMLGEEWQWENNTTADGKKNISRIYTILEGVNINDAGDWPEIISFFKPRIIALDAFWSAARYNIAGI